MRSAAAAVLLFAAGWGSHAVLGPQAPAAAGYPAYVERALGGHLLYAGDLTLARSFNPSEFDLAMQIISDEFGYRFRQDAFELPGLEIDRVRYMQQETGPVALFTYRDAAGQQATLYVQPHSAEEPSYDLNLDRGPHGSVAYWSDDDLDYTVIASVDKEGMLPLIASIGAPVSR